MKYIKRFESVSKKYSMDSALQQVMASPIGPKKLRFTFPSNNYEMFAAILLKKLGIITCYFNSINEVIEEIRKIKKTGFIADEVVFETHGRTGRLIVTKEDGAVGPYSLHNFDEQFLPELKTIISKNSKVIFTSCEGANALYVLKKSAEILGCRVYGSKGRYYPGRNYSEEGWYYCNPTPIHDVTAEPREQANLSLIKSKKCVKCETPISWVKYLVPSGH